MRYRITPRAVRYLTDGFAMVLIGGALIVGGARYLWPQFDAMLHTQERARLAVMTELTSTGRRIGSDDAPVVLAVFSTYRCGFCAEYHESLTRLLQRYPQHLALVLHHYVAPDQLDDYRIPMAAECAAEQGLYAAFHSAAFGHSNLLLYPDGWVALWDTVGLPDMGEYRRCVEEERFRLLIEQDYARGQRLGVSGTPTTFIAGRRFVGAVPLEFLDSLIARRLR